MLVYCQPYGTIPEVFDAVFSGQGQLWQIQLVHEARPSVCYRIVNHWAEFLKSMNESDTSTPANMREFERSWSAKLAITNTDDEACLGHVPYRIAFYVGGDTAAVANFAGLLDAFFKHRCEDETEPRFVSTVAVTWHVLEGEGISIKTYEMDCRTDVQDVKRADFCVAITDAQPPSRQRRHTIAHFQSAAPALLSIVFSGDTCPLRKEFAEADVPGQRDDGT